MAEENVLSQNEVDALLSALESGDVAFKKEDKKKVCVTYDFRNPILVPKEVVRILRVLHENFSRNVALSLSGYLRSLVQVELVSVDQLTYNEFTLSLPSITYLNIVSNAPLKGNMIVEVNVNMMLMFIERLLGGDAKKQITPRGLSELEMSISNKIIRRILRDYRNAWSHIIDFHPRIESRTTDPRFAQIVKPEEIVLLVCFEINFSGASGIINICFPISSFEPLIDMILKHAKTRRVLKEEEGMSDMQMSLLYTPMTVNAQLDTFPMTLEDVLELNVGDVLRLDRKTKEGADLLVNGKELFRVDLSARKQRKLVILRDKYED